MGIIRYKLLYTSLLLFAVSLFCLPAEAPAKARQVVFIRYRIATGYFANTVKEFKDTMSRRGYQEGKDIDYVDVLTRSADNDSIPDVLEAVRRYRHSADLFITCGWVSMPAREALKETGIPQLFVPVLKSVALQMLPSMKAPPATNLSGIYLMYPPEKILRLSRLIMPKATRYAYVYDSSIPADLVFKSEYEELAQEGRHGFSLFFFDLAAGETKVLAGLRDQHIEVYGGIVGLFKHRRALAASRLPLITSFTLDIDQSAIKDYVGEDMLAGLFDPFDFCGSEAAEMTADIFDGKKNIENMVPRPAKQLAFINLKAASQRKLRVSFDALESVDLIIK